MPQPLPATRTGRSPTVIVPMSLKPAAAARARAYSSAVTPTPAATVSFGGAPAARKASSCKPSLARSASESSTNPQPLSAPDSTATEPSTPSRNPEATTAAPAASRHRPPAHAASGAAAAASNPESGERVRSDVAASQRPGRRLDETKPPLHRTRAARVDAAVQVRPARAVGRPIRDPGCCRRTVHATDVISSVRLRNPPSAARASSRTVMARKTQRGSSAGSASGPCSVMRAVTSVPPDACGISRCSTSSARPWNSCSRGRQRRAVHHVVDLDRKLPARKPHLRQQLLAGHRCRSRRLTSASAFCSAGSTALTNGSNSTHRSGCASTAQTSLTGAALLARALAEARSRKPSGRRSRRASPGTGNAGSEAKDGTDGMPPILPRMVAE